MILGQFRLTLSNYILIFILSTWYLYYFNGDFLKSWLKLWPVGDFSSINFYYVAAIALDWFEENNSSKKIALDLFKFRILRPVDSSWNFVVWFASLETWSSATFYLNFGLFTFLLLFNYLILLVKFKPCSLSGS